MSKRLDNVIEILSRYQNETAYILGCLMDYKNIINCGDCNSCAQKGCVYRPELGKPVRYNCFLYVKKEDDT